jgi:hypothetical protein
VFVLDSKRKEVADCGTNRKESWGRSEKPMRLREQRDC